MMQKSESKKLILIYLQQLFWEKTDKNHYIRISDIFSYLESKGIFADRRTIYTDISLLKSINFDIVGVREKGGHKYHYPYRKFDDNELKFLIDSVAASKFLTERKSRELIEKIKSLGSIYSKDILKRNMLVSNRIKSMNDKVLKNLDIIYQAISCNYKITFQYMKWTPERKLVYRREGRQYLVSPFAVTLCDDNYYLIAFDSNTQSIRHYRIDKMQTINSTADKREGKEYYKKFDITDYMQKTFNMFGGEEETVSIKCENSLAGVFIDRFGDSVFIRPDFDNPDMFVARITVNVSPQFYAWIFALGKAVKILSPKWVVQEFAVMTETVLNNYRS